MGAEPGYEGSIKQAKESIAEISGDSEPEVLRYGFDRGSNIFTFRTKIGVFSVAVGLDGNVRVRREEPRAFLPSIAPEAGEDSTSRIAAMEKALGFVGEGRIQAVEARDGGYTVEIGRSGAVPVKVFVDKDGMVRESERPGAVRLRVDIT